MSWLPDKKHLARLLSLILTYSINGLGTNCKEGKKRRGTGKSKDSESMSQLVLVLLATSVVSQLAFWVHVQKLPCFLKPFARHCYHAVYVSGKLHVTPRNQLDKFMIHWRLKFMSSFTGYLLSLICMLSCQTGLLWPVSYICSPE